jgi:hypothetical protein
VCARVGNQRSRGVVTAQVRTDAVRSLRHQRRDLHQSTYPVPLGRSGFILLSTHEVLFEFLVRPFSLMNAPATFEALMNDVLHRFAPVFFDDILIYTPSWSEHLHHVHLVLNKLLEDTLFVKRSKCVIDARFVPYLATSKRQGSLAGCTGACLLLRKGNVSLLAT